MSALVQQLIPDSPKPVWFRLEGYGKYHRGRIYRDGIVVFDCVGYRENLCVKQLASTHRPPTISMRCARCRLDSQKGKR